MTAIEILVSRAKEAHRDALVVRNGKSIHALPEGSYAAYVQLTSERRAYLNSARIVRAVERTSIVKH